jgi:hypothetical protein
VRLGTASKKSQPPWVSLSPRSSILMFKNARLSSDQHCGDGSGHSVGCGPLPCGYDASSGQLRLNRGSIICQRCSRPRKLRGCSLMQASSRLLLPCRPSRAIVWGTRLLVLFWRPAHGCRLRSVPWSGSGGKRKIGPLAPADVSEWSDEETDDLLIHKPCGSARTDFSA